MAVFNFSLSHELSGNGSQRELRTFRYFEACEDATCGSSCLADRETWYFFPFFNPFKWNVPRPDASSTMISF